MPSVHSVAYSRNTPVFASPRQILNCTFIDSPRLPVSNDPAFLAKAPSEFASNHPLLWMRSCSLSKNALLCRDNLREIVHRDFLCVPVRRARLPQKLTADFSGRSPCANRGCILDYR